MPGALSAAQPEKILKELEALWIELGKADPEKRNAVLRACSMTFLVALEQGEDAQAAGQTLAELMHEHPSRAIVLRIDFEPGDRLEAQVLAQCWMPFGRRQQICCEQIEISASASCLEDVPRIVMGVTVPDLPVVLWCRGARLYTDSHFQEIFPLVDKVIVDSSTFADPAAGFAFVRDLSAHRVVGDLAWTRLTRWREMVALLFDDPTSRSLLDRIQSVKISHYGADPPVSARYLAGWFHQTLPAVKTVFASEDSASGDIVAIALTGPGLDASIRLSGSCAQLKLNGLVSRTPVAQPAEWELLREELSVLGRDPIFENSLK